MDKLVTLILSFFILTSRDPIIREVNKQRIINNLPILTEDKRLDKSATDKACELRDTDFWSHQDPQGNFSWPLFLKEGYNYHYAGENLAKDCDDLYCVSLWMTSPTHRGIILNKDYRDIGVGRCGKYKVIHLGQV